MDFLNKTLRKNKIFMQIKKSTNSRNVNPVEADLIHRLKSKSWVEVKQIGRRGGKQNIGHGKMVFRAP